MRVHANRGESNWVATRAHYTRAGASRLTRWRTCARGSKHGGMSLRDLRDALRGLPDAAAHALDDEFAQRVRQNVALVVAALDHLEQGRTAARVANRAPSARRCLARLRAALSVEGARGWPETVAPVLRALEAADDALARVERAQAEAARAVAQALSEAA